jgi:hypothetical protein
MARKSFALIYITPDVDQPGIVERFRKGESAFPANANVDPKIIGTCLYWSSWGFIGDVLARLYQANVVEEVERKFTLDLLSYLSGKRLWKNTLADDPLFYGDKLYRSLTRADSPFVPYGDGKAERYQGWRTKPCQEEKLRDYLNGLRIEDKAILKLLADAGGALQQHVLMEKMPSLHGKTAHP